MSRRVPTARSCLAFVVLATLLAGAALGSAHASEPTGMLPNLVADPPDEAQLTTSSVEGHSRLLLRFTGYLHNDGEGAVDVRGTRSEPVVSGKTPREVKEQVRFAQLAEKSLPQKLEEELATPPMQAEQRIFEVGEIQGRPEESLQRTHLDLPINAQIIYSDADGHHHWHLQRIARYSLWNASRTAEVAPAQKVGFCLTDSQHVEAQKGPSSPVYADNVPPYEEFCRRFEPNATNLYEGISPGWRDRYGNELAFQWVDASNVAPGEYWLREDVDPERVLEEAGGGAKYSYASEPTVIPGFVAQPQSVEDGEGAPVVIDLTASRYDDETTPVESVVSPPAHGTLGAVEDGHVTYTPDPGFSGTDSFSFAARDADSQFPEDPPVAEVSVAVASREPTISLGNVQQSMVAGTAQELAAAVANDEGGVAWEASAGSIATAGPDGRAARFTAPAAPPPGGTVTITARLVDHPSTSAAATISVAPPPPPVPQPELPQEEQATAPPGGTTTGPVTGSTSGSTGTTEGGAPKPAGGPAAASNRAPAAVRDLARTGGVEAPEGAVPEPAVQPLSAPRAMIVSRELVITTTPLLAGRISISAKGRGNRPLGGCAAVTVAKRAFSCRLKLAPGFSPRDPIAIVVQLRAGSGIWRVTTAPRVVAQMVMRPVGSGAHAAAASGEFWCSPGTLVETLAPGP